MTIMIEPFIKRILLLGLIGNALMLAIVVNHVLGEGEEELTELKVLEIKLYKDGTGFLRFSNQTILHFEHIFVHPEYEYQNETIRHANGLPFFG